MLVIARHAEIALKGGNRSFFEKHLIDNIKRGAVARGLEEPTIRKDMTRLVCDFKEDDQASVADVLAHTFGVHDFSFVDRAEPEEQAILAVARRHIEAIKDKGAQSTNLSVKRAHKQFPKNSMEMSKEMGGIATALGLKVDFSNEQDVVYLEITKDAAYLSSDKRPGPGGLPVGTAGKVLVLLSGGIDSAVAAHQLMKRGCTIDYLHIHPHPDNERVLDTKIAEIVRKLQKYQPDSTLWLAPYHEYQLRTVGAIPQHLDLVGFKRFLLRVAERLAYREGYRAIGTGDALAQVASQTLQNLAAQRSGLEILLLSPLMGYDKQEIVDLAGRADVFVQGDYKDCCSIVSKKASTAVKPEVLDQALKDSPFAEAVEATANQVTKHQVR